jgi:hypothetical protein
VGTFITTGLGQLLSSTTKGVVTLTVLAGG